MCTILWSACASAPRNPALDGYPAGVTGRTTVLYYDVHGRTIEELQADMNRLGPKIDGASVVGETRSPMRWGWHTRSIGGSCSIRDVTVGVAAEITLPRWTPPADAEPGLGAEWKRFMDALEEHEAGHKDISATAGREIIDRVQGLSGPCSQIDSRGNEIARAIVERAHERQQTYDAETRHGLTQGTLFGVRRFTGLTIGSVADTGKLLVAVGGGTGGDRGTVRASLPVPLDRAWAALPAAYAAHGLVINATQISLHAVADTFTARGIIGSEPVSAIVDCGTRPAGRHADSAAVAMSVTSRLEPGQSATTMVTNALAAIVRQPEGAPLVCRSRGVLERRLFETLLNQVTR